MLYRLSIFGNSFFLPRKAKILNLLLGQENNLEFSKKIIYNKTVTPLDCTCGKNSQKSDPDDAKKSLMPNVIFAT